MKITKRDIDSFLCNPQRYKAALIYGADEGQVRQYGRHICLRILGDDFDPLNLVELNGQQLAEDSAKLADELNALSLIGGKRVVWLREPLADAAALIKEIMIDSGRETEAWLLVTAGELSAQSKLRTLFERQKDLAILACYHDEGRDLERFVSSELHRLGINAQAEVISHMAKMLGNDRAVTLSEIEKIDLYLGDERKLTFEQLEDLLGDNAQFTIYKLCNVVAVGDISRLSDLLHKLYDSGVQPIGVLRVVYAHLQKLLQLHNLCSKGISVEQAMTQMRVFFKQKPEMRKQLSRWDMKNLRKMLDLLLSAECEIKTTDSSCAAVICANILQQIALRAARAQR